MAADEKFMSTDEVVPLVPSLVVTISTGFDKSVERVDSVLDAPCCS